MWRVPGRMKRILIVKPSSLGDIVHGLLVAQSIHEQMADGSITWVAREIFAPLVQSCLAVDHTIIFPRQRWLTGMGRFVCELRREEYDYVLDMQGLARSGLMTLLARSRVKIGRSDARELAGWACTQRAPLPATGSKSHAVEVLLQFLPLLGLQAKLGKPIRLEPESLPPPHDKLAAARPIVLLPHSRKRKKEWPGFVKLTQLLLARHEETLVVWSSHKRCTVPEAVASHPRFHNLTAQTTLRQMIGLIAGARVVVVNDSGPLHIAAAVGTPLVACFGPTPPELYGPYPLDCPRHRIVRAPDGNLARLEASVVLAAVETSLQTNTPQ